MSQSGDIRAGIAANLEPLLISNGGPVGQVLPFLPSNPTPPCIYVADDAISYDLANRRGLDQLAFVVVALVSFTTDQAAQESLDELRDPSGSSSIKTLIESDRTLGGACQDLRVTEASKPQLYVRDSGPASLGAEWTVQVYATG